MVAQAIKVGVSVPPRPRPALCKPLAKPLSLALVDEAITRTQPGETAAPPTPVRNRRTGRPSRTRHPVPTAACGWTPLTRAPGPTHNHGAVTVPAGPWRR